MRYLLSLKIGLFSHYFWAFLYILNGSPLSDIWFVNIFSQLVAYLFYPNSVFQRTEVLILVKFNLSFFSFMMMRRREWGRENGIKKILLLFLLVSPPPCPFPNNKKNKVAFYLRGRFWPVEFQGPWKVSRRVCGTWERSGLQSGSRIISPQESFKAEAWMRPPGE